MMVLLVKARRCSRHERCLDASSSVFKGLRGRALLAWLAPVLAPRP